jgi:hypothetical protein
MPVSASPAGKTGKTASVEICISGIFKEDVYLPKKNISVEEHRTQIYRQIIAVSVSISIVMAAVSIVMAAITIVMEAISIVMAAITIVTGFITIEIGFITIEIESITIVTGFITIVTGFITIETETLTAIFFPAMQIKRMKNCIGKFFILHFSFIILRSTSV